MKKSLKIALVSAAGTFGVMASVVGGLAECGLKMVVAAGEAGIHVYEGAAFSIKSTAKAIHEINEADKATDEESNQTEELEVEAF